MNNQGFLLQLKSIISRNLENENFSVAELAEELGLSTSQTLRKVKKVTGVGANQLIREIRLEHAAELLEGEQELNISEIAYKVGFSSPSYFIKCFHDKYKTTPGAYKKKGRKYNRVLVVLLGSVFFVLLISTYLIIPERAENSDHQMITSIAVLPLLDITSDQSLEYLAIGITDDLTHELSKYKNLRVVSRGSAMLFRDSLKLYGDIANQLGVDLLLEGSVMNKGEGLQVILQLIQPHPAEQHLWTDKYELKSDQVYNLAILAAQAIGQEMGLEAYALSRSNSMLNVNPQAYDHYLRGRYLLDQQHPATVLQAIEHSQSAIDIDSSFASAYALLARCYISMNRFIRNNEEKLHNKQQGRQMIFKALEKAIREDGSLAEAYITYGYVLGKLSWDWEGMKKMIDKGLILDPNSSEGYLLLSDYWAINGNMSESLHAAQKALELDPLNPYAGTMLAQKFELNRQYQLALAQYEKVLELFPEYSLAWNGMGFSYYMIGEKEKTRACWKKLHEIMGNQEMANYFQKEYFDKAVAHWLEEATKTQKLYCSNPSIIAMAFMLDEQRSVSLEYLEYAYTMQNEELPILLLHPVFDSLHGTFPYEQIVQRLNIKRAFPQRM